MPLKYSETLLLKLSSIGKCAKFRDFHFSIVHFTNIFSNFRKQQEDQVGDRCKEFN